MAYTIYLTNGTVLTTVADGTTNSTAASTLTLIGKNFSGYGRFLNDNLVYMLENSSNATPPTTPLTGQLWWDTAGNLKVYTGSAFKTLGSMTSSSTQPTSGVTGNSWWDTANRQLKIYDSSAGWTLIGPAFTAGTGTSGSIVETITDSNSNPQTAVSIYSGNVRLSIFSANTNTYTPLVGISGFTTIKPGLNMSTSITGAKFQGTATNADALNSVAAANYARTDTATNFSSNVGFPDAGVTVGSNNNFTVGMSGNVVQLTNNINNANIAIRANIGGTLTSVLTVNGSTGTITGYQINAQYADLAERFEADAVYTPGTVLSMGGDKEVTLENSELSENVFGVISTKAGYLMNSAAGSDDTHPPVAVSGRVPVRVIGRIKKGDRLVSAGNGLARSGSKIELTPFNIIGRSLENKTTDQEGTILAIVKLNS
jgi:hypothetical protein